MNKKWLILITLMVLAGVLVSGCADNAEENEVDIETETEDSQITEEEEMPIGEGTPFGVRMEYYGKMTPAEIEINRGDSIVWRNQKPQNSYVLVSDDGLFEDKEMYVHDTHTYTFTKSGTYTFSVRDVPDMVLTVTVR
ncbi:hypothetical protein [Methanolobus sp. WCC5]|jgi:plastocyanin|uniref:hypothetical protein n=1 Tax=Methanolobus sp. WCC5 TaxID=3125785 RepID=UPI003255A0F5